MADLVTRLKLDDTQFNNNINKSKKQLNDFKSVGKSAGNTITDVLGASLTKIAAPVAIATTAFKGMQEVMMSSQKNADLLDTEMYALKQTVDEFFYSLGNGNLKSFLNDLDGLVTKSKQAYQALDQLGNTQISYGVISSRNQANIANAQYTAKNKFASNDERIAAFEQWRAAIESEQKGVEQLQADLVGYVTKAVQAKSTANINVTLDDVIKAFEADLTGANRDEIKKRAANGYGNWEVNNADKYKSQQQKDEIAEGLKQHIITHTMLQKYTDDELKDIAEKVSAYFKLTNAVKGLGREYNETANEFNNSNAKTSGFSPVGSLEGYKVYSGNSTSKAGSEKKIDPLELAAFNAQGWVNEEIKGLHNAMRIAIETGEKIPIKSLPIEIEDEAVDELALPSLSDEPNKWALGITESFALAGSSIQALGGAFAAFSENAALGKSALILGAIGQLVYGYAQAAAKPMHPWEWIAFAISGAATLATTIAQIKGYADGGIVNSPYTTGDRNLVKVNGGEMILTRGQQANLFNLLNGGSLNNNNGEVKFRISGKELVGVLSNYNNKMSKVL